MLYFNTSLPRFACPRPLCRIHPRTKNQPIINLFESEEKENVSALRNFVHPLKYPEKLSLRSGKMICRYENYDKKGCFKHRDPFKLGGVGCQLDHDECHKCAEVGHRAWDCPHLDCKRLR